MSLQLGKSAPPFKLASISGEISELSLLCNDNPVVLFFYKVNCPTCQFATPFFERLHQSGAKVTGICQTLDPVAAISYHRTYEATFPVLLEQPGYQTSNQYNISVVPTAFLVNQAGNIQVVMESFEKDQLSAIADALTLPSPFLSGEKVPAIKPG